MIGPDHGGPTVSRWPTAAAGNHLEACRSALRTWAGLDVRRHTALLVLLTVVLVNPIWGQTSLSELPAAEQPPQVEITAQRIGPPPPIAPVTVLDVEQARREGVTTTEDLLRRLSSNLPSTVTAQAVGGGFGGASVADLRGLGDGHTLVLLNGRRVANNAQNATSPDLNVIPFAALERVEVIRDGASAVYGAGAVGGVINFITKDSYSGAQLDVQTVVPARRGGGSRRATLTAGAGDLLLGRANGMLILDVQRSDALRSRDRACCDAVVIPERGIDFGSSGTDPANYAQTQTATLPDTGTGQVTYYGNPAWPACRSTKAGRLYNPGDGSGRCFVDTAPWEDIQPLVTRANVMGLATYRLDAYQSFHAEAFASTSTVIGEISPVRLSGLIVAPGTRFFPGAGITPAPSNFTIDPTLPVVLTWRASAAGGRRNETNNVGQRGLLAFNGRLGGEDDYWDVDASLAQYLSKVTARLAGGYTDQGLMQQGLDQGVINPFATPDAAGRAWIARAGITGTAWSTTGRSTALDAHADRALPDWFDAARKGHLRLQFEATQDRLTTHNNTDLQARQSVGGTSVLATDSASRVTRALGMKVDLPMRPSLDFSAAWRRDHYSDFGSTDAHSLGLRWRPSAEWALQLSRGRSFFVPSMFMLHGRQSLDPASVAYDDPKLCPGGTPLPGADPGKVCNQFFQVLSGSNPSLKPGLANTQTASLIVEPLRNVRFELDLWRISEFHNFADPSLQSIIASPVAYADKIIRHPDGTIAYVDTRVTNLSHARAHGIDIAAEVHGAGPFGSRLGLQFEGTHVSSLAYQRGTLLTYAENVGKFLDYTAIPRWQHSVSISFMKGKWSGLVSHRYTAGYWDENFVAPEYYNRVKPWSVVDASLTWAPDDRRSVTFGVSNLLDTAPPFSNQGQTFQVGYDPRISDPTGRAFFMSFSYRFQ